jgi:hypothetical protein
MRPIRGDLADGLGNHQRSVCTAPFLAHARAKKLLIEVAEPEAVVTRLGTALRE